jgi:hypothetical protein
VTIAALLRLLDEIDQQGGPEAARQNRLQLPDEGTEPMTTAPVNLPAADVRLKAVTTDQPAENIPIGKLLAWGDQHADPDVQDQAARARIALTGLRQRYTADRELEQITSEAEELERRLAELRARREQLVPAKPKKRKTPLDYDAAVVRAWARDNGHACPDRGRIPGKVVDAWRAATTPAAS